MSDLGQSMKIVLADTFCLYMLAHKSHFNVEGRDFYQYHTLFQTIYEELWEAVDDIAEHIRALDEYVPFNFARLQELTTIEDDNKIPTASAMVDKLLENNDKAIKSLIAAIEAAKLANDSANENFLSSRKEAHDKHGWMLRSTTKKNRE